MYYGFNKNAKIIASSFIVGSALHSDCLVYFSEGQLKAGQRPHAAPSLCKKKLWLEIMRPPARFPQSVLLPLRTRTARAVGTKPQTPTFIFTGPSVSPL